MAFGLDRALKKGYGVSKPTLWYRLVHYMYSIRNHILPNPYSYDKGLYCENY
jgi:hypothetical protein